MHPDDQFQVQTIVKYAEDAGRRIGLVIDLTNTDRYYNKSEWMDHNIQYRKLNCPGHEVSDREDIVQEFHTIVHEFLSDPNNGNELIGVHCTHGLNRTGYLICRYLIDHMGWTASDAITKFEYFRGHGIERGHYINSLQEAERNIKQKDSKIETTGSEDTADVKAV